MFVRNGHYYVHKIGTIEVKGNKIDPEMVFHLCNFPQWSSFNPEAKRVKYKGYKLHTTKWFSGYAGSDILFKVSNYKWAIPTSFGWKYVKDPVIATSWLLLF